MTTSDTENKKSTVKIALVDPHGKGIGDLDYYIKLAGKIVAKGKTNPLGEIDSFVTEINSLLSVYVKRFATDEMKHIKTIIPWSEKFSLKLVSSKKKEEVALLEDEGGAGSYKRKTYTVKADDSLEKIAKENGTTVQAIATLNSIPVDSKISSGKVLKLPNKEAASVSVNVSKNVAPTASESNSHQSETVSTATPAVPLADQVALSNIKMKVENAPVATTVLVDRGGNGTPKSTVNAICDQKACITIGDKGPLVEEINIRLTGFGGTISAPTPLNEFTAQTAKAVAQFQRDYMGSAETGKVCGSVLAALDDFLVKFPINLGEMKCGCGKCNGFGNGYNDSEKVKIVDSKNNPKIITGVEYPGMHRCLIWAFRAAKFYVAVKDKTLGYAYFGLSSGYRCWHNNKAHHRLTTNHMGNALDLQFKKLSAKTRCQGADVDKIRADIFKKRLGAVLGWSSNKLGLETAAQGATSWVHVDVREFSAIYKLDRYYAVTQAQVDGDKLIEIAKREGRLALINCGGVRLTTSTQNNSVPQPSQQDVRTPIESLKISNHGIDFIKGWEKLGLSRYDDSEGFCTVGWGHLIARKSCSSFGDDGPYKDGITREAADALFVRDVGRTESIVKSRVLVPMYQHEYDALVSLIFNLGGFDKCPKLLSNLNTKNYSGCCDEFSDITNHGVSGLVKRRKAEMDIFRHKKYDSTH